MIAICMQMHEYEQNSLWTMRKATPGLFYWNLLAMDIWPCINDMIQIRKKNWQLHRSVCVEMMMPVSTILQQYTCLCEVVVVIVTEV